MQGEFRGDFTRDTYNPSKQFLRVLMQQGRVQIDADWNEQVSILLNYIQTLATDLIGPYGGPKNNCAFKIILLTNDNIEQKINPLPIDENEKTNLKNQFQIQKRNNNEINFLIGPGNYYVYGKLCQNQKYVLYSQQSNYPSIVDEEKLKDNQTYLVYLDVWERHISYLEDENELIPSIREIALEKADTTTRSQLIWQVKVKEIDKPSNLNALNTFVNEIKNPERLRKEILRQPPNKNKIKPGTGRLKARAKILTGADISNPCRISPDSRYRGAENQLYRVEIHQSGETGNATFKWSRENASVIFPVQQVSGMNITLSHLGWDNRFSLKQADWVELVYDEYLLQGRAESLLQVDSIDTMEITVKLKNPVSSLPLGGHPLLRRWDQQQNSNINWNSAEGTIRVEEGKWIELENGIEIQFSSQQDSTKEQGFYATGDYWLIPSRTATGDVEWPKERDGSNLVPSAIPPHGIEHHYAPLWIIVDGAQGDNFSDRDCRCTFSDILDKQDIVM